MILIKIILIMSILAMMVLILRSYNARRRALTILAALAFTLLAVSAIIFPDWTTRLAHTVGIGRGADLVLYCLVIVIIYQLVNNTLRQRREQQRFAELIRHIALGEAPNPDSLNPLNQPNQRHPPDQPTRPDQLDPPDSRPGQAP